MTYRITRVWIYEAQTRLDALEQFEREYPGQGHDVDVIEEGALSRRLTNLEQFDRDVASAMSHRALATDQCTGGSRYHEDALRER